MSAIVIVNASNAGPHHSVKRNPLPPTSCSLQKPERLRRLRHRRNPKMSVQAPIWTKPKCPVSDVPRRCRSTLLSVRTTRLPRRVRICVAPSSPTVFPRPAPRRNIRTLQLAINTAEAATKTKTPRLRPTTTEVPPIRIARKSANRVNRANRANRPAILARHSPDASLAVRLRFPRSVSRAIGPAGRQLRASLRPVLKCHPSPARRATFTPRAKGSRLTILFDMRLRAQPRVRLASASNSRPLHPSSVKSAVLLPTLALVLRPSTTHPTHLPPRTTSDIRGSSDRRTSRLHPAETTRILRRGGRRQRERVRAGRGRFT